MTQQEIQPTYVTYNQAVWLKEKGFNEPCRQRIWEGFEKEPHFESDCVSANYNDYDDSSTTYYSAPEQWLVIEWLRVNHGIWINVTIGQETKWEYIIGDIPTCGVLHYSSMFDSPQEAYSAAFDYIISNNLI